LAEERPNNSKEENNQYTPTSVVLLAVSQQNMMDCDLHACAALLELANYCANDSGEAGNKQDITF
jgi:hypothetical protein